MRSPWASAVILGAALAPLLFPAPLARAEARPKLTIERIFAEPALDGTLPTGPQWLPDGKRLSFVERDGQGEAATTTLVLLDAETGARADLAVEQRLPAFPAAKPGLPDERVRVADPVWAPDASAALLSSGRSLFLLDAKSGALRRLTNSPSSDEDPQFSPDGRRVAFVRDHDLYVADVATGAETRLTFDGGPERYNGVLDWVYREELADADTRAFVWSPDGRAIALLSLDERGVPRYPITDWTALQPPTENQLYPKPGDPSPQASLRVVRLPDGLPAAETRVALAPDAYLPRLGWTPDGRVWFESLDRPQTRLALNVLVEGRAKEILVEEDKAWINLEGEPLFLPDGRFVWSSEKGGRRALYLHAADGRELRPLVAGPFEVTALLSAGPDGVVYVANAPTVRERQLFRAPLEGGAPRRLTAERGTHVVVAAPRGGLFLDRASAADRPWSLWILGPDGARLRPVVANDRPPVADFARGEVRFLEIDGPAGSKLEASLLLPPDFDPAKKHPALVYVYGGPHAQVVQDAWGGRYALFHQYLAERGFVVFSVDNRGSFGRGRDFERAILGRLGKAELEDQLAGVAWLKAQPFVDPARVGIWGWSYGGYMTCYALTHAPGVFKAGAAVAPVTDWRFYDSAYTERYLKLPKDNPDGYRDSSPVNAAAKLDGALLVVHGSGDDNVHWGNTIAFVDALYKAGRPYDLQIYPNKTHGILGQAARTHLHRRLAAHFIHALAPELTEEIR
ncbi:MAG: S9 family peptidase [Candidatus Polarisedimenticolia bacterium]|nr:S9 family peptidase [bacterium]